MGVLYEKFNKNENNILYLFSKDGVYIDFFNNFVKKICIEKDNKPIIKVGIWTDDKATLRTLDEEAQYMHYTIENINSSFKNTFNKNSETYLVSVNGEMLFFKNIVVKIEGANKKIYSINKGFLECLTVTPKVWERFTFNRITDYELNSVCDYQFNKNEFELETDFKL